MPIEACRPDKKLHPKVSVIIATLNSASTLRNCLNSIFNQRRSDIEIIIIDGGSADGTVGIIKANETRLHHWKSEQDGGVYEAMNKGLKHVTADWIYFLGADDELRPAFSDMLDELDDQAVIYYGNVFSAGEVKLGELNRYQFAKYGPYHQAMLYPKSVFEKYRFDIRYRLSADFALTLRLCGDKSFRIVYKNHTIANFNHAGLTGTHIDDVFQRDKAALIFKNFGWVIWLRYLLRRYKRRNNPRA